MKTTRNALLLTLALVAQAFAWTGCAHTAKGLSQDYHAAEDHVENAVK